MKLENYIDAYILLVSLMKVSSDREITFGNGFVRVKGKNGEIHEIKTGAANGITFHAIDCAIEASMD